MKKIIQVFFFIIFSNPVTAQIISIEKIKAVHQSEFNSTKDSNLIFPVFRLKNKKAEYKINQKLLDDFKEERSIDKYEKDIRTILVKASKEGLTDIDFEITYQTKRIVALTLQWGGNGAYPTTWQSQYCFNILSGNLITLDSIIDKNKKSEFLKLIKKKEEANIINNKKALSDQLQKKELDKETYNWAIEEMKGCWHNYAAKKFTIDKYTLTVIIECDFPRAILALSPDSDIKLNLKNISRYINNKYKYLIN